jgi:Ca2+-binding EF-hand superfamily protein
MTKKLQEDSKFNQFDTDGDGVVTDEELARSERMLQIENNDKMQDQQRLNGLGCDVEYHRSCCSAPKPVHSH